MIGMAKQSGIVPRQLGDTIRLGVSSRRFSNSNFTFAPSAGLFIVQISNRECPSDSTKE